MKMYTNVGVDITFLGYPTNKQYMPFKKIVG